MEYKLQRISNNIVCNTKAIIDDEKCYIKIILGASEYDIIKEFMNSIRNIELKEKMKPNILTFNRRDYMAFILSRIVKYYDNFNNEILPLNKWEIEDIRDKFGNFNDEYILFDYFGLSKINNKFYHLEDILTDKQELIDFFKTTTTKIYNLSLISSRILENTYTNNFGPKVIVALEVEPLLEKKEEFIKTFPYLKDEPEETIIRWMKNNFAFSRLLGISICRLGNNRISTNLPVDTKKVAN